MVITGQGFRDPAFPHNDERDAVCQGPSLVRACLVKINSAIKKLVGCTDHKCARIRSQVVQESPKQRSVGCVGHRITYLSEHSGCGHKRTSQRYSPLRCFLVGLVVGAVWLATQHPFVFAIVLTLVLVLMWIVTWMLLRFLRAALRRLRAFFSPDSAPS